jgi:3-deoxy-D-manno-octulosonic-acid transferase
MIKRGGYGKKIFYRLGLWPHLPPKNSKRTRIWIQAVSVGELSSIHSLLQSFLSNPNIEIVLSGTTSTGQRIAEQKYSHDVLACGPFPLDWFPFSSLTWSRIKPDLALCVDSELWPEHMYQAKRNGVPFSIINARLSNRSYNRLRRLGIFQNLLIPENLQILASSEKQFDRWKNIGVDSNNILSTGNLKVDISPLNPPSLTQKNDRKKELGFPPSSLVLVGISTWPGEEKLLLEALEQIRASKIDARLLLIPRHVERRNEILNTLSSFAFSYRQRTQPQQNKIECLVYFADTTGELIDLIECADIAFLGKTLPPRHEGQNPIEPISMGLPLVIGPACTNFSETCDELLACGAIKQGHSVEQVKKILVSLIHNGEQKAKMNKAGLNWRKEQGSPTQNTVNQLKKFYRS